MNIKKISLKIFSIIILLINITAMAENDENEKYFIKNLTTKPNLSLGLAFPGSKPEFYY